MGSTPWLEVLKGLGPGEDLVFNTLTREKIQESYRELAKRISQAQIVAFPDGAILGNEPEAGGKLLRLVLNNPLVKEAIEEHLHHKDGLILGIGSGFQGLIKSGLIDFGRINPSEVRTIITDNLADGFVSVC